MKMRPEYLLAGLVISAVTSIGGAVYTYISNKKFYKTKDEIVKDCMNLERDVKDRCRKISEDLDESLKKKVDGIANSLDVDVPDEIVEAALKKAAETETKRSIDATSREIISEYRSTMRAEVRKSVDLAYENTKTDVKKELTRQIENIDISGIKREIINDVKDRVKEELDDAIDKIKGKFEDDLEEAKDSAQEKFEEELESISTRFSSDLERGSKIYKALSEKLGTG